MNPNSIICKDRNKLDSDMYHRLPDLDGAMPNGEQCRIEAVCVDKSDSHVLSPNLSPRKGHQQSWRVLIRLYHPETAWVERYNRNQVQP